MSVRVNEEMAREREAEKEALAAMAREWEPEKLATEFRKVANKPGELIEAAAKIGLARFVFMSELYERGWSMRQVADMGNIPLNTLTQAKANEVKRVDSYVRKGWIKGADENE